MRFRPIVMTSAAFLLGVVPLVFSSGGGAESRHSIGTGGFGGVIAATVLGLIFTPAAFYLVMRATQRRSTKTGARGARTGSAAGEDVHDPETESS
jgi:HAE1 family hydrophobic/amphiphilic exporter-1